MSLTASDVAFGAMLLTQRCCLRSDVAFGAMCAYGTLRIYLNFG